MSDVDVEYLYTALLMHPVDAWRIKNQRALCILRDEIAHRRNQDAETVQTSFEEWVAVNGRP